MAALLFDPGQMTARLTRLVPVDVADGQGGSTRSWSDAGRLWARIEPLAQRIEPVVAGAERVTVTHEIWVSFQAGVAEGERLTRGTRIFAIKALRDADETARFILCQCEEVAI